jgi:hypothetical protein
MDLLLNLTIVFFGSWAVLYFLLAWFGNDLIPKIILSPQKEAYKTSDKLAFKMAFEVAILIVALRVIAC